MAKKKLLEILSDTGQNTKDITEDTLDNAKIRTVKTMEKSQQVKEDDLDDALDEELDEEALEDEELEEELKVSSKDIAKTKFKLDLPKINRVKQLPSDEIVEVTVIKDYTHMVAKKQYAYKAMVPTTVPLHVAEILKDAGVLYEGGLSKDLVASVQRRKKGEPKQVDVRLMGQRD